MIVRLEVERGRRFIAIRFNEHSAPIAAIEVPAVLTIDRIGALRQMCCNLLEVLDGLERELSAPGAN